MKKFTSFFVFVLAACLFIAGSVNAQGKHGIVGKKFNKKEANALFGKVIGSVKIQKADLKEALADAKDYVHFVVKNNRGYILNEKRQSLLKKERFELKAKEKSHYFSKEVVEEFVNNSTEDEFTLEVRAGVLTVSDNFNTLEMSGVCPPVCFD